LSHKKYGRAATPPFFLIWGKTFVGEWFNKYKLIVTPPAVHGGGLLGGGAKKLRLTGLFTLRRSSGSAYGFARSFATLIPTQKLRHILPALKMLRIFLFGLAKRRKQPERYTTYHLSW
jgi:hypothetical protein